MKDDLNEHAPSDKNHAIAKDLFDKSSSGWAAWKWIETTSRPALKKSFPRLPIIDKKIRMKLKKDIVIGGNTMNGCKVFRSLRAMKNMI
jgi:hypothetical protein